MMRDENAITVTTLNDIIVHKLTGILNKLEIDATTDEERHLQRELQTVLEQHVVVATKLKSEASTSHESI